jgi:MFS family permease
MTLQTTPKGAWPVAVMLFGYMLVNFADKAVVGLAAVPIMKELSLTPQQFGLLGSAFFLLYSVSAIGVGFLANRRPTKWIILVLALSWAVVQFPMVLSVSFGTLLVCRVLLGIGEGPAASVATHAVYKWFPDSKRTIPTAVLSQGAAFGVIVALPALNWIIIHVSWHWAFGALGIVGLLWSAGWLVVGREGPLLDPPEIAGGRVPYSRLLLSRTFIGCTLACFGAYWSLSLGLTWFTPFIVRGLGFSQQSAGWLATLPWVIGATTVISAGVISQALVGRGVSTRAARAVLGAVPMIVGGGLLLLLPWVGDGALEIALLMLGTGLTGPIYVVCAPMLSEFTPVAQRGAVIAIFGAIYTLAGVVAPFANGSIIEAAATPLAGYHTGFMVCAVMQIVGGLAGLALMWPAADRARIARLRAGAEASIQVARVL